MTSLATPKPSVRLATLDDNVHHVTALINHAYKVGERGIVVDTPEQPFERMRQEDLRNLIQSQSLLLLVSHNKQIIGCVKVNKHITEDSPYSSLHGTLQGKVGEWGGIAVVPEHQHQGYGTVLQQAAEQCLREHGCAIAQLELLTPSHWKHDHKERLRQWYCDKLGYTLKIQDDYTSSTTTFSSGALLLGRILLGTDVDFTLYRRKIPNAKPSLLAPVAEDVDAATAQGLEYVVPGPKIISFRENGFVVLDHVISPPEINRYVDLLKQMLHGEISTSNKRGDLGGHTNRVDQEVENTVQIIHPYVLTSKLDGCEHFRIGEEIAEQLYTPVGCKSRTENWGLDCAQFIVKFAHTDTETPWHQDQSYYPDELTDKRACNIWLALEDCTVESGCMRFVPTPLTCSELTPHRAAGNGKGALMTDPPNGVDTQVCTPLKAGSVVVFNNYTYHFGGPNTSDGWRPAFVAQYRPKRMIQMCRELGFDHGKFQSNEDGSNRTKRATKE